MSTARERYSKLSSNRHQFLDTAVECSKLTLPYLISRDNEARNHKNTCHSVAVSW